MNYYHGLLHNRKLAEVRRAPDWRIDRSVTGLSALRLGFGSVALAFGAFGAVAADVYSGMPADLPIAEIASVHRDWQPHLCRKSDRQKVIGAIEAYIACGTFYRTDLCERAGLYPSPLWRDSYDLYGEGDTSPFDPDPAVVQYRLLEFRSLDARYSPPLLVVHMESRTCYRVGPPPRCGPWWPRYAVISHLDTAAPAITASGTVKPSP